MKPGTKPTPTAIKELKGTLRKDRISKSEPIAEPLAEIPPAPDWLNSWAVEEWYVTTKWLHGIGLLSAIDESIVAAYCQQMGVFREAEDELKDRRVIVTDKGYEMPSPWVAIGNRALMQALKIATEYGLTPSSRSRITIGKLQKAKTKLELIKERRK